MSAAMPNDPAPGLRVVLVGRTGLDAALRRDGAMELQRARNHLEALGEASLPIGEGSPAACAVVAAPDAVPAEEQESFVAAVRRVAPHARVLIVTDDETSPPAPFDGRIARGADAAALRRELRSTADERRWTIAPAPMPGALLESPRSPHAPAAPSARTVPGVPGDPGPLEALLRGGDARAAAIAEVRRALAPASVEFLAARPGEPAPAPARLPPGAIAAEVRRGDRLFGWLVGPCAEAPRLAERAPALALWFAAAAQHEQLRAAAFTDHESGAWNRRHLERFLPGAIDDARARREACVLVLLRPAPGGDPCATAAMLKSRIRAEDRCARFDHQTFALVLVAPLAPRRPGGAARFIGDAAALAARFAPATFAAAGLAIYPWDAPDAPGLISAAQRMLDAAPDEPGATAAHHP